MKKPSAFVVAPDMGVSPLFYKNRWDVSERMEEADLVVLTGGADIQPHLYNQHKHRSTYPSVQRDHREMINIALARKLNKPMAGICRGAQLLNALNGGSMWQDIDNHAIGSVHPCKDVRTGEVFLMTSTHHQMMIPGPKADVIAVASVSTERHRMSDLIKDKVEISEYGRKPDVDIEILMYPEDKAFCIQGHPEYGVHGVGEIFFDYIDEFFNLRAA